MDFLNNPLVIAAIISGGSAVLAAVVAASKGESLLRELRRQRIARRRGKVRVACPHIEIEILSDRVGVRALPISPPGTLMYYCGVCGGMFHHEDVARLQNSWLDNFSRDHTRTMKEYNSQWSRTNRLRRKLDLLGDD